MEEKKRRGLALLSKERRREIASMGGKRAHELGTAHRFDKETGSIAGKKGGRRKVSRETFDDNPDIK